MGKRVKYEKNHQSKADKGNLHFTPFENVGSILKYGIMSNEEINKKDFHSLKVDNNRFDGRENFICTSVSFPNSRLLRFKQYSLGLLS